MSSLDLMALVLYVALTSIAVVLLVALGYLAARGAAYSEKPKRKRKNDEFEALEDYVWKAPPSADIDSTYIPEALTGSAVPAGHARSIGVSQDVVDFNSAAIRRAQLSAGFYTGGFYSLGESGIYPRDQRASGWIALADIDNILRSMSGVNHD